MDERPKTISVLPNVSLLVKDDAKSFRSTAAYWPAHFSPRVLKVLQRIPADDSSTGHV